MTLGGGQSRILQNAWILSSTWEHQGEGREWPSRLQAETQPVDARVTFPTICCPPRGQQSLGTSFGLKQRWGNTEELAEEVGREGSTQTFGGLRKLSHPNASQS